MIDKEDWLHGKLATALEIREWCEEHDGDLDDYLNWLNAELEDAMGERRKAATPA